MPRRLCLLAVVALLPRVESSAQSGPDSPWVAHVAFKRLSNPVLATMDAVQPRREVFLFECAQCHGHNGDGTGPQAYPIRARVPDLAQPSIQRQSDGELFWKITNGRGEEPTSSLDEPQIWAVIHFHRTLPSRRQHRVVPPHHHRHDRAPDGVTGERCSHQGGCPLLTRQ